MYLWSSKCCLAEHKRLLWDTWKTDPEKAVFFFFFLFFCSVKERQWRWVAVRSRKGAMRLDVTSSNLHFNLCCEQLTAVSSEHVCARGLGSPSFLCGSRWWRGRRTARSRQSARLWLPVRKRGRRGWGPRWCRIWFGMWDPKAFWLACLEGPLNYAYLVFRFLAHWMINRKN